MTRWARAHRVFFFEEPIYGPEDEGLVITTDASGVRVVTPHLTSRTPDEAATIRGLLEALMVDHRIEHFISWYYTPMALSFTSGLEPKAVVYDCMDELSLFRGAPPQVQERELMRRASLVFTGGHRLYSAKRTQHHDVHPFPSSVDVAHFASARMEGRDDPDEQSQIPHPRLGFFGVIDERFDAELIGELAQRRPDWHLVMVGPFAKIDPARLPHAPNIHYLGQKKYESLPDYLAGWDVALLPFAINDATRFISPTKTPEYLAGGLPVVSTPIHDVVHPYEDLGLVRIASDAGEFEEAIEQSLIEDRVERQRRADAFLSKLSWDHTWSQMKSHVDRAVSSPRVERPMIPRVVKPRFDYLIAGAGFSGAVMAERLAEHGKRVLIVDKREHVGGNAYDHLDAAGVLVHKYGPHIFHTNSDDVFEYLSRFTQWRPYEHRVLAHVEGQLLPIPINLDTVNRLYGWELNPDSLAAYFRRVAVPLDTIRTSEDVIVSKVGRDLYEKFFHNYTFKQWGLYPSQLDRGVIEPIPVRTNHDDRSFTDTHQAMPAHGFTAMFKNMLDHENITVELGCDYRDAARRVNATELVYTGPVDEYFGCCFGKLPYRSIDFRFETRDVEWHQPVAVVNYPNENPWTRITEFKHLSGQKLSRTTLVYEYPTGDGDPYYPVPRPENAALYKRYQELANETRGVHFVGRLATYRYSNMDQCVAQALTLASKLMGVWRGELRGAVEGEV